MKVLILDDNRIVLGEPLDGGHDYRSDIVIQCDSVETFFGFLSNNTWGEVWIDHDLGIPNFNGKDVSYRILCDAKMHNTMYEIGVIRVISMNPAAIRPMWDDLRQAGYRVVTTPMSSMKDHGVSRAETRPLVVV